MKQDDIKHLTILSESELQDVYGQPNFNHEQRKHYFTLSKEVSSLIQSLENHVKIYFILQWGYFHAKHRFSNCTIDEVNEDVRFIVNTILKNGMVISSLKIPSKNTMTKVKGMIADLYKYKKIDVDKKKNLLIQANRLIRQHSKPKIIFKKLSNYIECKRWILPSYSVMQDLIGRAMNVELDRLTNKLMKILPKKTQTGLDDLMATEEDLYGISILKKDIKNFQCKELRKEIKKRDKNIEIYHVAQKVLPKLKISSGNVAYYAALAEYYPPYKLKRSLNNQAYLYLLCYVYHRIQKINNNIVQSFIYRVSKFHEEAIDYGKIQFLLSQRDFSYEKEKLGIILGYFCENSLQRYRFSTISKRAFKLMPKPMIIKVSKFFKNETRKETNFRWDYFSNKRRAITLNIKPLFMAINFECEEPNNSVILAANHLKSIFKDNQTLSNCNVNLLPKGAIPKKMKSYVEGEEGIDPYKYAFMVYYRLMKYLVNNKIYCNDSLSFKSFNEDIKVTSDWDNKKDKILQRLALPKLSAPMAERLKELEEELEQAYIDVNMRIESGENNDVRLKPDGETWTLRYPKENNEEFDHPFFRKLDKINIGLVFDFVNKQCNFMDCFEHQLPRNYKRKIDRQYVKVSIIANGTWQGNYNMAGRSNLEFDKLQRTEKDRLRVATIKAACDRISRETEKLSFFHFRNICAYGYHGSIDGSKHVTKRETIKSRYSSKYFGLEKGVSSLNMVVNELPVNCDIIGANEYEGHYLYDLYHGNTSGIDPSILSTDTAGSNQVNFYLMDNVDVVYAPAYKSIFDRAQSLCGFKPISTYGNLLIKPNAQVPKKLILEHEDEIKRICTSLCLNETSQHIVIQKICCRERQTQLKKALWAYSKIFFSLHVLKYIDSKEYKRVIRKTLNRGEGYNRLFNSVVNVGGKKLRGLSETEMRIWDHCTRLITLIIIYYNTYILTKVYEQRSEQSDQRAADILNKVSPFAVVHLNLSGVYHYSDDEESIDVEAVISKIDTLLDGLI